MTTQIALRLTDAELTILDGEVMSGRASTRSDAARRAIRLLDREARYTADDGILADLARRDEIPYPDLAGVASLPTPPVD